MTSSKKKKGRSKYDTPKSTTAATRSKTATKLDTMFLELDEYGRVADGSNYVSAHKRPQKNKPNSTSKIPSKTDLMKEGAAAHDPKSILKKAAGSASSKSTQSVTFDKKVKVPDVVITSPGSSPVHPENSRGTQSDLATPSGNQGAKETPKPARKTSTFGDKTGSFPR